MNKISKIILAVALVMLTSVAKAQDKKKHVQPYQHLGNITNHCP